MSGKFNWDDYEDADAPSRPAADPKAFNWDDYADDVSQGRTAALGVAQGGTMGFADEIGGAIGAATMNEPVRANLEILPDDSPEVVALKKQMQAEQGDVPSNYQLVRDNMRGEWSDAKKVNPGTAFVSELAGGLAVPIPGGAAAQGTKIGARLLRAGGQGAAMGAAYGAGSSEADLLKGEVGDFAIDTGLGALAGAGGGVIGEGVGSTLGWAGRKIKGGFQKNADDATADLLAQESEKLTKRGRSIQGEFGKAVQEPVGNLDRFELALKRLPPGPERDAVEAYLNSPEAIDLLKNAVMNKLDDAPRLHGVMDEKKLAHEAFQASKAQELANRVANAGSNAIKEQVKPRIMKLAHRFVPPAVGALIGGPAGFIAGGVASFAQGAPGLIIRNLVRSPAARQTFWRALLKVTGGSQQKAAGLLRPLMAAEAKGDKALATTAYVLSQKFPEIREALRLVAGLGEGPEASEVAER